MATLTPGRIYYYAGSGPLLPIYSAKLVALLPGGMAQVHSANPCAGHPLVLPAHLLRGSAGGLCTKRAAAMACGGAMP